MEVAIAGFKVIEGRAQVGWIQESEAGHAVVEASVSYGLHGDLIRLLGKLGEYGCEVLGLEPGKFICNGFKKKDMGDFESVIITGKMGTNLDSPIGISTPLIKMDGSDVLGIEKPLQKTLDLVCSEIRLYLFSGKSNQQVLPFFQDYALLDGAVQEQGDDLADRIEELAAEGKDGKTI